MFDLTQDFKPGRVSESAKALTVVANVRKELLADAEPSQFSNDLNRVERMLEDPVFQKNLNIQVSICLNLLQ